MNKSTPITQKAKSPSPLKDINNFRHDRRDYEKSKYKKGKL